MWPPLPPPEMLNEQQEESQKNGNHFMMIQVKMWQMSLII